MSNQYFDGLYKKPDLNEEPVIDMGGQVQNQDPFEDAIPLAAAQINSPVKETDDQHLNQDPYEDAIPLVAAQIEEVVDEPDDLILNQNRLGDEGPTDADVVYDDPSESNVIVIDPINVPVSDDFPVINDPVLQVPVTGFDTRNSLLDETIPASILVGGSLIDESLPYKAAPIEETFDETPDGEIPAVIMDAPKATLSNLDDSQIYHNRWDAIQSQFVDDPKDAVMQADVLISEIIEQIKQKFDDEHTILKNTWFQSNESSTEDLRKTLQKYHAFVDLLLV
ncbi:MAG: hypothetical protein ACYDH1_17620 [Anaerolineaceae bacterium]